MIQVDDYEVVIVEQKRGKDKRKRKIKRAEIDEEFIVKHRD